MKNIAIINSVYEKSTGKIARGFVEYLRLQGYNAFLCYGYGKKITGNEFYRIDTFLERYIHAFQCRIFGDQGFHSTFATKRLIRFLKKNNIDTIYGIGLHGYYLNEKKIFDYISKNNISFVYIMTEEYPFLGKCGYSDGCQNYKKGCGHCPQLKEYPKSFFFDRTRKIFSMKKEAYSKIAKFIAVGPEYTILAAKKSPLMENKKLFVLDESIDTSFYSPRDTSLLKNKLNISDNKIIIECIAPMSYPRKGCKYFIELARAFEDDDRFVFVHVGYDIDYCKLPRNYIAIGYVSNQDTLAEYYSLADLFVFPSLLDTMPNACLEALSCGTPILCFDVSGMPFLTDEKAGTYVKAKDVDSLVRVVNHTQKKNKEISNYCRCYAIQRYDRKKYYFELTKIGKML